MIDVCGNDGATARDFGADEFGSDFVWNICTKRVTSVLMT